MLVVNMQRETLAIKVSLLYDLFLDQRIWSELGFQGDFLYFINHEKKKKMVNSSPNNEDEFGKACLRGYR